MFGLTRSTRSRPPKAGGAPVVAPAAAPLHPGSPVRLPGKLEIWPIERLRPYDRNPRTHSPEQVTKIAASLLEFGWTNPILVDAEGGIVAGHGRLLAAKELGMTTVPVIELPHLTEAQRRAYVIADNRLALDAGWNEELLAEELKALGELDFNLELTGFDLDELHDLLEDETAEEVVAPEPPEDPVTRPGDLWILGGHRLLCGDSSDPAAVDRMHAGAPIHLVNTDPPYNVKVEPRSNNAIAAGLSSFAGLKHHQRFDLERHKVKATAKGKMRPKDRPLANDFVTDVAFAEMLMAWFGNMARVLLPGRSFYIWGGYANIANYPSALKGAGLYFSQSIIWDKQHPVLTRKDFMGAHEWCQPAGTQVLTPEGNVPIESLRSGDRVVSFSRHYNHLVGTRQGESIAARSRPYAGDLLGIVVGDKTTWCTSTHLWTVRLSEAAAGLWCTYLMRKGDWWRVGKSRLITSWGFGLKQRLYQEGGEEAWVIGIYGSSLDAAIDEQVILAEYGVPTFTWSEQHYRKGLRQIDDVRKVYDRLDLDRMRHGALRLLKDYGRLPDCPIVTAWRNRVKVSRRVTTTVQACNILPGAMVVPCPTGSGLGIRWEPIRAVDRQRFDGLVYSMDVNRFHHYIADGIVTHNCFYGWKEGAAHQFFGPANIPDLWAVKKVNPQSMIHLCLHPEALVLTESGYRPIRSVVVGDPVYAADGCFHPVLDVTSHAYQSPELVRIVAKGGNLPTLASDNHPFLIWRPERKGRSIVGGKVGWLRADEISVGDYTMTPLLEEPAEDPFPDRDEEFWFLFGLYVAQGSLQRAGHGPNRYPAFHLHKRRQDLIARIRNRWESVGEYDPNDYGERCQGVTVMAFDPEVGAAFEELGGRRSYAKRLAPDVFRLPRAKRIAVLQGWLNGDGCRVHDRSYWQGNTCSPDLAAHLALLGESVGYKANLFRYDPPVELGMINGRRIQSQRPVFHLYFYARDPNVRRGRLTHLEHEGRAYALRYVRSVDRVPYAGEVWNLTVEGSHTFQTAVGMSHNTEKPVELAVRAIQYSSRPRENVLDLFGGSGSTLIGAEETGRHAFLMELDPAYCDVIVQRWQTAAGQKAVLDGDGATYEAVGAERGTPREE